MRQREIVVMVYHVNIYPKLYRANCYFSDLLIVLLLSVIVLLCLIQNIMLFYQRIILKAVINAC